MKLDQCRDGDSRLPYLHARASRRIQHPGGHHDNYTGLHLDMNDLTVIASFSVLAPNTAPVEGMPPVVNFDFRLDMGRMSA